MSSAIRQAGESWIDTMPQTPPDQPPPDMPPDSPPAPDRPLTPAARRALAEAQARRAAIDARALALAKDREVDGRGGLEPVRYDDWEVKGIASDF